MAKRISDLTTVTSIQSADYMEVSRGTTSVKRDIFDEFADNLGLVGGLLWNVGIKATLASSAMTIYLTQSDGATAPGPNSARSRIAFRSATAANGAWEVIEAASSVSVGLSAGSTAGFSSGIADALYVYAINYAGTIELAWRTDAILDTSTLQSTTAEGGAGAADSRNVLYSTTARSNVPVRLIGRIDISQATAGNWVTAPTAISVAPNIADPFNTPEKTYTPTFTGFGTVSNIYATFRRIGPMLKISGRATAGTTSSTEARISLPNNMVAASTISTIQFAGVTARGSAGASALYCLREPNVGYITFGMQNSTAAALTKLLGNTTVEVGETFSFEAEVPVQSFK